MHAGDVEWCLQMIAETRIDELNWLFKARIDGSFGISDTELFHLLTNLAWILQTFKACDGGFWHKTPSSLFSCLNKLRLPCSSPGSRDKKIRLCGIAMIQRANRHCKRARYPLAVSAMTDQLAA